MLTVSDLSRSIRFYTDTLGFLHGRSMPGRWTELVSTGFALFLIERRSGQTFENHGANGITLVVHDIERKKKVLEARGAAFIGDTVDAETLRVAILEDPDGNPIYLVEERDDHPTIPLPFIAQQSAGGAL
jgi:catechol 2,3-dioxygenase-like lactoylglutathione lyase family enzyme